MAKSRTRNLMELRRDAQRRLPRVAFDFVDGGADDEVVCGRNRSAFDNFSLIPRVLAGVSEISTETQLFGQRLTMPVLLAPAGAVLVAGSDADAAAARGAEAAGTISVQAWQPKVEVAASDAARQWYQLYLTRDRQHMADSIARAKRFGFSALVVTADVPVAGNRERDIRNGFTVPLRPTSLLTPRIAIDVARRPRWLWSYMRSGAKRGATFERGVSGKIREVQSLSEAIRAEFNPHQSWNDLKWLRDLWVGPLLLKGVMCSEDAELAVQAGCEGVIVSNHGGRQLDGTPASIEVLPEIIATVNGRAEVLLDGGIRRGTDVAKALCIGARACLVGRPWVFAVAVGGEAGVRRMLETLHEELVRTLHLLGAASTADLGPSFVRQRSGTAWQAVGKSCRETRPTDVGESRS